MSLSKPTAAPPIQPGSPLHRLLVHLANKISDCHAKNVSLGDGINRPRQKALHGGERPRKPRGQSGPV
jgi:hypothetical protein